MEGFQKINGNKKSEIKREPPIPQKTKKVNDFTNPSAAEKNKGTHPIILDMDVTIITLPLSRIFMIMSDLSDSNR